MKVTQRIPTEQYAYIEFEQEYASVEEALAEHTELCKRYQDAGLPANQWAKLRNKMYATGEWDVNVEGLSKAQAYVINQLKLAQRALSADEPVIN